MRLFSIAVLFVAVSAAGCNKEDPRKANEAEAKKADKKLGEENKDVKAQTTAVKRGKVIACTDWITDPKAFGAGLKEAGMGGRPDYIKKKKDDETDWDTVLLEDSRRKHRKSGLTSACNIRRPGKPPTMKEQEKMSKSSGLLGVLPGDTWCNIRAFCGVAEQKNYEKVCRDKARKATDTRYFVNKEMGVTACVRATIMGKYDAFSYRFMDDDTKCFLEVRGGPSIHDEAKVRACAKLAMKQFTKATLEKAK